MRIFVYFALFMLLLAPTVQAAELPLAGEQPEQMFTETYAEGLPQARNEQPQLGLLANVMTFGTGDYGLAGLWAVSVLLFGYALWLAKRAES